MVYLPVSSFLNTAAFYEFCLDNTVKPVLNGHSKIDKTKVSKTNGSLMKDESTAKLLSWTCIKQSSVLKPNFGLLCEWLLKTGFTV